MKKRVAFHTLGCKLNFAETSTIARSFPADRYERVSPDGDADIFVINTCSVTETADRKCRQAIRSIISRNPDAFIAVVGCYAQLRPEEASSIEGVDLVLGTYEKFNIASYAESLGRMKAPEVHSCEQVRTREFIASWSAGDRTRSFLKIQDGCDYRCSYCTVPLARGRSRNQSIEGVVDEARRITESGVKEIVLTGVNVGDFGKSTGETLYDLLCALVDINGLKRLRLSSIEPDLLTDGIIDLAAREPALMPHFHMPLQSGSDRILSLMRRRYHREVFRDRVTSIINRIPDAGIGADVITGFPGETDDDFEDTYHFIEELPLSYLHVFSFSPRPGTPAASMPGAVTKAEKERRSRQLIRLSQSRRMMFMQKASGSISDVLLEKRNSEGMIAGLTGNYIRAMVPYRSDLPGTICKVKLTAIRNEDSMNGELVETFKE